MKINKCRYTHTGSGYNTQAYIEWYVQLDDNREVIVSEWQDWEGCSIEAWTADIDFNKEPELYKKCISLVEDGNYDYYEDTKRYSKKALLEDQSVTWAEYQDEDYLLDPELDPELNN
jgi:hypothetical protein